MTLELHKPCKVNPGISKPDLGRPLLLHVCIRMRVRLPGCTSASRAIRRPHQLFVYLSYEFTRKYIAYLVRRIVFTGQIVPDAVARLRRRWRHFRIKAPVSVPHTDTCAAPAARAHDAGAWCKWDRGTSRQHWFPEVPPADRIPGQICCTHVLGSEGMVWGRVNWWVYIRRWKTRWKCESAVSPLLIGVV